MFGDRDIMCLSSEGPENDVQGDHLSGKPGNVREFETCQGNVRDVVNSQGNVREKILSWKNTLTCTHSMQIH